MNVWANARCGGFGRWLVGAGGNPRVIWIWNVACCSWSSRNPSRFRVELGTWRLFWYLLLLFFFWDVWRPYNYKLSMNLDQPVTQNEHRVNRERKRCFIVFYRWRIWKSFKILHAMWKQLQVSFQSSQPVCCGICKKLQESLPIPTVFSKLVGFVSWLCLFQHSQPGRRRNPWMHENSAPLAPACGAQGIFHEKHVGFVGCWYFLLGFSNPRYG